MSSRDYVIALIFSFLLSLLIIPGIIWLAKKFKAIDYPDNERKIHKKPTPLLGGAAIFFSFNLALLFYAFYTKDLIGDTISAKNLLGIVFGGLFLMIGGVLDDKFNLAPRWQIICPILAVFSVIVSGIGIDWITNPLGKGILYLNEFEFKLFWYNGFPYKITLFADIFTFIWLMAMMYTTKLLDGLDGLVSGLTIIGAAFIFFTAMNKGEIIQSDVALLAVILFGVFAGFLVFNFNPAAIFLGEGGSIMAGFLLGSLSIISGSKVGITLMLFSIPLLDFIWTIIRRLIEKRSPFSSPDRKHLHHRFLDAGFSVRKAVFSLYFLAIVFGIVAYYFQEHGNLFLGIAILAILTFCLILAYLYRKIRLKYKY